MTARSLVALLSGLVFALGLGLAGMTRPTAVLGFLELRDPALALTMFAAVAVAALGFPLLLRRGRPLLARRFDLPRRDVIDRPLLLGAAVFGVGWGLVGLCPGPAITDLVTLDPDLWLFVAAMLIGMVVRRRRERG